MFLNNLFLDYAEFVLGYLNLGFSKKGVGNHVFGQKFFKFLIGLYPILFVTMLAPCDNFNMFIHCPHVKYSVAYQVFDKMH